MTPSTTPADLPTERKMSSEQTISVMAATSRMAYLVTRSALHIGCGDSLGDVDQPVVRNPVTQMPCIPAAALKRSLRDHSPMDGEQAALLFGTEGGRAGHLAPQEAQLLLLPVASGHGGVAWVTSAGLLAAYARQAMRCGSAWGPWPSQAMQVHQVLLVHQQSALLPGRGIGPVVQLWDQHLMPVDAPEPVRQALKSLVDRAFAGEEPDWRALVLSRVAVVHDRLLLALAECLDVRTRNAIGEDGLAANLWREETVPEDAVFYAPIAAHPLAGGPSTAGLAAVRGWMEAVASNPLQLQVGGNGSLGQGWMQLHLGSQQGRA